MIIHRTTDLVTPTNCVLAIDHQGKRRLAYRSTARRVVFEALRPWSSETGDAAAADWGYEADAPIQTQERHLPEIRNRLGQRGAYCEVASLGDLQTLAASQGMTWCARSRWDATCAR